MKPVSTLRFAPPLIAALLSLAASSEGVAQGAGKGLPKEVPPFEIATINANSWYGRFGLTNCAWIDLGEGVMVIDTGATAADAGNLAAQIKETTKGKPVKWIVMTHLHEDSNRGLTAFLPSDVTIFVNHKVSAGVAAGVISKGKGMKTPTVVGVSDKIFVVSGVHGVEIGSLPGHTGHDIYAFVAESGALFSGDIVTPGRCPMMSDSGTDPKAWLAALDKFESLHPGVIIPTRGNSSQLVENELNQTRSYIKRLMDILTRAKKASFPETRVAGELAQHKIGEYCPIELDSINALSIYRRITPEGTIIPPAPPARPAAPAKKKQ